MGAEMAAPCPTKYLATERHKAQAGGVDSKRIYFLGGGGSPQGCGGWEGGGVAVQGACIPPAEG